MNPKICRNDILIIPDIHGRQFWKEAVASNDGSHIVFLGDYVDPYPNEHISPSDALANFREIIDYKIQHDDTTTLLIGNHDMHYISELFADMAMSSRYNDAYAHLYAYMFHHHAQLFQLAYEAHYDGVDCLFTHAGVSTTWLKEYTHLSEHITASELNALTHSIEGIKALARICDLRGGWDLAGSILWADINEMYYDEPLTGWYQIFGHTQQFDGPIITPHFACLDCRMAFSLSEVLKMAHSP